MDKQKISLNDKILKTFNIIAAVIMIGCIVFYFILWNKRNGFLPIIAIAAVAVSTLVNLYMLTKEK